MVYGAMVRKVWSTSHGQRCLRSRSHAMTARRRAIGSRGSDFAVGRSDAIRLNLNHDYRIIYIMTNIYEVILSWYYQLIFILCFRSAISFSPRAASLAGTPKVSRMPSLGSPGFCVTRSNTTLGSASPGVLTLS